MSLEDEVEEFPYVGSSFDRSREERFQDPQLTEPPVTYGVCGLTCPEDYSDDDEVR